jgi:hypothetical protein
VFRVQLESYIAKKVWVTHCSNAIGKATGKMFHDYDDPLLRADRPYPRRRRLVQLQEVVGSGKWMDIRRLAEHD